MGNITRREIRNCPEVMYFAQYVSEDRIPGLPYNLDMTAEYIFGDYAWSLISTNTHTQRSTQSKMSRSIRKLDLAKEYYAVLN